MVVPAGADAWLTLSLKLAPCPHRKAIEPEVRFEIVGRIHSVRPIAAGPGLKVRALLRKAYGPGRWRKLKGIATIRLPNGELRQVELHWYEAHGVGRRDFKIKRYMDVP